MICARCGSKAGALVRIEGDLQGRRCFVCTQCDTNRQPTITSPLGCVQRVKSAEYGIDLCGGHALAYCSSCRKATCREHLMKRTPRGLRTAAHQCKQCRARTRTASRRRAVAAQPVPWWA